MRKNAYFCRRKSKNRDIFGRYTTHTKNNGQKVGHIRISKSIDLDEEMFRELLVHEMIHHYVRTYIPQSHQHPAKQTPSILTPHCTTYYYLNRYRYIRNALLGYYVYLCGRFLKLIEYEHRKETIAKNEVRNQETS